jgi:hypothetical protein
MSAQVSAESRHRVTICLHIAMRLRFVVIAPESGLGDFRVRRMIEPLRFLAAVRARNGDPAASGPSHDKPSRSWEL